MYAKPRSNFSIERTSNGELRLLSGDVATAMNLVTPSQEHLESFTAALEQGWSADNVRGKVATDEELAHLRGDPAAFLESLVDREAK